MSDDGDSSSDDDDDDDDDDDRLAAKDGLSGHVLAALLEFQAGGGSFAGDDNDDDKLIITRDTVCAAYRPEDTAVIAETLRRLQEREQSAMLGTSSSSATQVLKERVVRPLEPPPCEEDNYAALQRDGVVRVNKVLTAELCEACLNYINESLQHSDDGPGFGNVFERTNRFDMYLRPEGLIDDALQHMLSPASPVGQLFQQLLMNDKNQSDDAVAANFHELSSLVADPGAIAQPIHPDAPYSEQAPLWTVFVALQDVTAEMGGTVFLPGTHTAECHAQFKSATERVRLLNGGGCEYRRADLRAGDCAVMDARTFHYGGANASASRRRRVLLYFTIRNPYYTTGPYPDCGSLFPDLDGVLTTQRYMEL